MTYKIKDFTLKNYKQMVTGIWGCFVFLPLNCTTGKGEKCLFNLQNKLPLICWGKNQQRQKKQSWKYVV